MSKPNQSASRRPFAPSKRPMILLGTSIVFVLLLVGVVTWVGNVSQGGQALILAIIFICIGLSLSVWLFMLFRKHTEVIEKTVALHEDLKQEINEGMEHLSVLIEQVSQKADVALEMIAKLNYLGGKTEDKAAMNPEAESIAQQVSRLLDNGTDEREVARKLSLSRDEAMLALSMVGNRNHTAEGQDTDAEPEEDQATPTYERTDTDERTEGPPSASKSLNTAHTVKLDEDDAWNDRYARWHKPVLWAAIAMAVVGSVLWYRSYTARLGDAASPYNQAEAQNGIPVKQKNINQDGVLSRPLHTANPDAKPGNLGGDRQENEQRPAPSLRKTNGPFQLRKRAHPYLVHAASFRKLSRASKAVAELQRKGYLTFAVLTHVPEKGQWYRIFVGDFLTQDAAQRVADELVQYGFADVAEVRTLPYTICIGPLASNEVAKEEITLLRNKGYFGTLMARSENNEQPIVAVGAFATELEATGVTDNLRQQGIFGQVVVR